MIKCYLQPLSSLKDELEMKYRPKYTVMEEVRRESVSRLFRYCLSNGRFIALIVRTKTRNRIVVSACTIFPFC